jgi:hypothetical protein
MMRFRVTLVFLGLLMIAQGTFADPIDFSHPVFQFAYASGLANFDGLVNIIRNPSPAPAPVMPADIVAFSVSATGPVAFEMSSTMGHPTIACGVACFDASPTGLSMLPGDFVTFSEHQGEGMMPTVSLTMTNDPTIIQATWFNAVDPGVVFTAVGPISAVPVSAVPEPATLTLVGLGALGIRFYRHRRG